MSLADIDVPTALVIIVSSFSTPEFGIPFQKEIKSAEPAPKNFFYGIDAISCMKQLFGLSENDAIYIGNLLLKCTLIHTSPGSSSSEFIDYHAKYSLRGASNLTDTIIIQNLAGAVLTLLECTELEITKALIEDVIYIAELDNANLISHMQIKAAAMSKLNTANGLLDAKPDIQRPISSKPFKKPKKDPRISSHFTKDVLKDKDRKTERSKDKVKDKTKGKKAAWATSMSTQDMQACSFYVELQDSDDIKFSNTEETSFPKVKAASIDKLIEKLTHEDGDVNFRDIFMLTYRSFMDPHQLLEKLDQRLHMFGESSKTIQIRIVGVIKVWIERYADDFIGDASLNETLLKFIEKISVMMVNSSTAQQLLNSLEKSREKHRANSRVEEMVEAKQYEWNDMDIQELAQQICIFEFNLYSSICPKETLNLNWSKHKERSPNVLAMIEHFNSTSRWVQLTIVRPVKLSERVFALTKFINLSQILFDMNNYNAVNEIKSGINSSPVRRLKKTWAELSEETIKKFEVLEKLMSHDGSYKEYREILHHCDPPTIPYLGTYLTDLTFIEDGNNDFDGTLVNFDKRYKIAAVIEEIQRYQKIGYKNITPEKYLQRWLTELPFVSEEEAYSISLKVEPRNPNEAVETMLINEQKLREEIQTLQLRNAALEKNIGELRRQLEAINRARAGQRRGNNRGRGRGILRGSTLERKPRQIAQNGGRVSQTAAPIGRRQMKKFPSQPTQVNQCLIPKIKPPTIGGSPPGVSLVSSHSTPVAPEVSHVPTPENSFFSNAREQEAVKDSVIESVQENSAIIQQRAPDKAKKVRKTTLGAARANWHKGSNFSVAEGSILQKQQPNPKLVVEPISEPSPQSNPAPNSKPYRNPSPEINPRQMILKPNRPLPKTPQ